MKGEFDVKKFMILFVLMTMVVNGGPTINLKASSLDLNNGNASLMYIFGYQVVQPHTVNVYSVKELENYLNRYYYIFDDDPMYFDRDKYDESFFKDNFLCFHFVALAGGGPPLEVTSILETADSIEVEITRPGFHPTADTGNWFLVLEMDRAHTAMDKDITVTMVKILPSDYIKDIWYITSSSSLDVTEPSIVKITSVLELEEYINNHVFEQRSTVFHDDEVLWPIDPEIYLDEKYDESFFKSNFLILAALWEPSGSTQHRVEAVREINDLIDVKIERILPVYGIDQPGFCYVIIEPSRSFVKKDVSLTIVERQLPGIRSVFVNDNITVDLTRPKVDNEAFIAAVYDVNGKLLSISQNVTETDRLNVYDVSVDIHQADTKTIKVMWWNGLEPMQPLCQAATMIKDNNGEWTMAD